MKIKQRICIHLIKTGEARALYNLANIYQSKGKHMGRLTYNDSCDPNSGEFAAEIKEVLMKAIFYYRETLKLVSAKDRAAEGRTYGKKKTLFFLYSSIASGFQKSYVHFLALKFYLLPV